MFKVLVVYVAVIFAVGALIACMPEEEKKKILDSIAAQDSKPAPSSRFERASSSDIGSEEQDENVPAGVTKEFQRQVEEFKANNAKVIRDVENNASFTDEQKQALIEFVKSFEKEAIELRLTLEEIQAKWEKEIANIQIIHDVPDDWMEPPFYGDNPDEYYFENDENIPELDLDIPPDDSGYIIGEGSTGETGGTWDLPEYNPPPIELIEPNIPDFPYDGDGIPIEVPAP